MYSKWDLTKSRNLGSFYIWEMIFVLIPSLLYGIFTQGMSPEDPALRQVYLMIFFAVIPITMISGSIIGLLLEKKIKNSRIFDLFSGCIDFCIVIISFLLILWFEWKFSFGWADFSNNYPGWHWQSYYQQRLLAILSGLLGFQFMTTQSKTYSNKIQYESVIGIIIICQLLFGMYFSQWYHVFIGLACIGMIFFILKLTLVFNRQNEWNSNNSDDRAIPTIIAPRFRIFFLGKPVLILLFGLGLGIMVVSHRWTGDWLFYFGLIIGFFIIIRLFFYKVVLNSTLKIRNIFLIIGLVILSILFLNLWMNHLVPNLLLWSVLLGGFVGFILSGFDSSSLSQKFSFLRPFQLIFGLVLFSIGVAGGIAYLHYVPLGEEIVMKVLTYSLIFLWALIILEFVIPPSKN